MTEKIRQNYANVHMKKKIYSGEAEGAFWA